MSAKFRVEKFRGFTLTVHPQPGFGSEMTLIWDATGHYFAGPVETDEEVVRYTRIMIPALRELTSTE